jgi:hypothetical protein
MHPVCHIMLTAISLSTLPDAAQAEFPSSQPADACQLAVRLDNRNEVSDDMAHAGGRLSLRNTGSTTCVLSPLPALSFEDGRLRPLTAERHIPPGMYPGPVLLPVTVFPGQEVGFLLRWIPGDIFEEGNCIRPAFIMLTIAGRTFRMPSRRTMCAAAGDTAYFDQAPLRGMN